MSDETKAPDRITLDFDGDSLRATREDTGEYVCGEDQYGLENINWYSEECITALRAEVERLRDRLEKTAATPDQTAKDRTL